MTLIICYGAFTNFTTVDKTPLKLHNIRWYKGITYVDNSKRVWVVSSGEKDLELLDTKEKMKDLLSIKEIFAIKLGYTDYIKQSNPPFRINQNIDVSNNTISWKRYYFAGFTPNGDIKTWRNGGTSETGKSTKRWNYGNFKNGY